MHGKCCKGIALFEREVGKITGSVLFIPPNQSGLNLFFSFFCRPKLFFRDHSNCNDPLIHLRQVTIIEKVRETILPITAMFLHATRIVIVDNPLHSNSESSFASNKVEAISPHRGHEAERSIVLEYFYSTYFQ